MIELRWTTKKTGDVLQYRTWNLCGGEFGAVVREPPAWTDWTDADDTLVIPSPPITDLPPYPQDNEPNN